MSQIAININTRIKGISRESLFLKRLMDILLCIVAFPFALLFISLGCLAMKLTSAGPVIFTQKRVGKNGKIFTIFKIRTMTYNSSG
jgi:lipopolysaccharide/colanic/teichoic acid biosynthesis glycosyltransferase